MRQRLPFKNGIPSKNTISRVMSQIKPEALKTCFSGWMKSIYVSFTNDLIAIDGKFIRESHNEDEDKKAAHIVNAYSSRSHLVLGQAKVDEKSNEKEADYILALKGNHENLNDNVRLFIETEKKKKNHGCLISHTEVDKGHGRIEERTCFVTDEIDWLDDRNKWIGLKSIAMIESKRTQLKGTQALNTDFI